MTDVAPERPSVERVLQELETFFGHALKDRNDNAYVLRKLATGNVADDAFRIQCLESVGGLLLSLHRAVSFEQDLQPQGQSYDSTLLLGLYKLLDFLVLEGVYPSVPSGVGLLPERRAKSLFYAKHDPTYVPLHGTNQLSLLLTDIFDPILDDFGRGVEPLVRHRILSDLITASVCLAHESVPSVFNSSFSTYLERLPTSTLFAAYTHLLQASNVEWFRSSISEQLSLLPLRKNGARSTIDFLAASHRPPEAQDEQNTAPASSGPSIPLEALQQAAKLLSSVPRSMMPASYFVSVAPQLLELLDERAEPALQKAAAFVIGNGILSKRNIGSPSTIGWKLFAVPIFEAIDPSMRVDTMERQAHALRPEPIETPLTTHKSLERAVRRLSILVLSHPNPNLTGRMVKPLLLALWALANHRGISFSATEVSKMALAILTQFFRLVGTAENLLIISDNILSTGSPIWTLAPDESGGICIRKATKETLLEIETDLEAQFRLVDDRVQTFCRLLTASKMNDEAISKFFLHVFKLQIHPKTDGWHRKLPEVHPLQPLARAKLLEALVENFADRLTKSSAHIMELVQDILQQYINSKYEPLAKEQGKISLSSLARIARKAEDKKARQDETHDLDDSLMVALSLLNAITVQLDFTAEMKGSKRLAEIRKLLENISKGSTGDESIKSQAQLALALLDTKQTTGDTADPGADVDAALDVQRTLALIMADIASDLPPIRRSALHALQALIKTQDAPLDVPPIALLLLDVIRTDKEEFVYLAAVQTTVQLALRRNLGYVLRLLIDSFQDIDEQTGVDGRLRVGEALSSIADELKDSQDPTFFETIRSAVHPLLAVASRRGHRQREQLARQREDRLQRKKRREAERAWSGAVPDVPMQEKENEYEDLTLGEKQHRLRELEAIESIVRGWEDTGFEEDVRIRASALSIVGRLFETSSHALNGTNESESTIEVCLSILTLELSPSQAILRRAAALGLFGILKGIDSIVEASSTSTTSTAPLLPVEDWSRVEKVLRWVVDTDPDDLTVGHSETVLDGLEAVRMKVVGNAIKDVGTRTDELDGKLRGLSVDPDLKMEESEPVAEVKRRLVIEEIE